MFWAGNFVEMKCKLVRLCLNWPNSMYKRYQKINNLPFHLFRFHFLLSSLLRCLLRQPENQWQANLNFISMISEICSLSWVEARTFKVEIRQVQTQTRRRIEIRNVVSKFQNQECSWFLVRIFALRGHSQITSRTLWRDWIRGFLTTCN